MDELSRDERRQAAMLKAHLRLARSFMAEDHWMRKSGLSQRGVEALAVMGVRTVADARALNWSAARATLKATDGVGSKTIAAIGRWRGESL